MKLQDMVFGIQKYTNTILEILRSGEETAEEFSQRVVGMKGLIESLQHAIPAGVMTEYNSFFDQFLVFCNCCANTDFLIENVDMMDSSLELLSECLGEIAKYCEKYVKMCACCGAQIIYSPLQNYYSEMRVKMGVHQQSVDETLNDKEYSCPNCGCSDRDRLIVSYLKRIHLDKANEDLKILQIAPAPSIHKWITQECPHIQYDTSDLFMEGVTYHSDIQDLKEIDNASYDVIICSHVLEHVRDDMRALEAMRRVLKDDGQVIFLVPVDLSRTKIDEEWGCSEEENWRRFGQNDHCRAYSKQGLLERLNEKFYVHELGKDYFGEEVFWNGGLTDTSTLYVLTKDDKVQLDKEHHFQVDVNLCKNGPLVSVIMSAYNHERFVAAAIESVINQSYKNIEFIVCDDASVDRTADEMRKYSSHFTKEFYFKENAGGRYQFLSQYVHGKYIAVMNSDDVWTSDKLAIQVDYLEKHPECGACLSWSMYTDENMNINYDDKIFLQKNRDKYAWMSFFWNYGNALCNPSSVFRTDYSDAALFFGSSNRQVPDLFKWVSVVQKTEIHIVPKVLTYMRRYKIGQVENTSASSKDNSVRHMVECGISWLNVIKYMEADYFLKAFSDMLVCADASTEKEIMCEKYFLMLNSPSQFLQYSALCYLNEVYSEIHNVLEEKYGYTKKMIWEDEINKGFGRNFV